MPFEKLMEYVAALPPAGSPLTLGELSARWGEPPERIADAVEALKVVSLLGVMDTFTEPGREHTYVTIRSSGRGSRD